MPCFYFKKTENMHPNDFLWSHRDSDCVPAQSGTDLNPVLRKALPAFMRQHEECPPDIVNSFIHSYADGSEYVFDSTDSPSVKEVVDSGMHITIGEHGYALTDRPAVDLDLTAHREHEASVIYDTYNEMQSTTVKQIMHSAAKGSSDSVDLRIQNNAIAYHWLDPSKLGLDEFGLDVERELNAVGVSDEAIREIIVDTVSNVVPRRDGFVTQSSALMPQNAKRRVRKLLRPIFFQMLFMRNGPLHTLYKQRGQKSSIPAGVRRFFSGTPPDVDFFSLWVNFAQTPNYLAQVELHNLSSVAGHVVEDFRKAMRNTVIAKVSMMHSGTLPEGTGDAYDRLFEKYYREIRDRFRPVHELVKLVRMYANQLNARTMGKATPKLRKQLDELFAKYATDIVFGLCMHRPTAMTDALNALEQWHTTLVDTMSHVMGTKMVISKGFVTIRGTLLENDLTKATDAFCVAVFGKRNAEEFQSEFKKMNSMLLDRFRMTAHGKKSTSDAAFKIALAKLETALNQLYEEHRAHNAKRTQIMFKNGYEMFYHLINTSDITAPVEESIRALAYKYGNQKPDRDTYPEMVLPLFNLYFFAMYMYMAHRNEEEVVPFRKYVFGSSSLRSVVSVPCDTPDQEIHKVIDVISNAVLSKKLDCSTMTAHELWTMCILLNDMVAYANGATPVFHTATVVKFVADATGVVLDKVMKECVV